jgi:hypothetical protein
MNLHADMAKKNHIGNANENRRDRNQQVGAAHVRLPSRYVRRGRLIGFPHGNAFDFRRIGQLAHLSGGLFIKKLSDIFGRRIDRVKGRLIVQKFVVDVADQISQDSLEVPEIKKQTYGIELLTFDLHAHAIIVAVRILTFAFVPTQRVPGGKRFFDADFKHRILS